MDINVYDEAALYAAAFEYATKKDNLSEAEAQELLMPDGEIDPDRCVQMLMDPGAGPAGMEIIESGVES